MLIGYARVSTDDQNLNLQRDALRGAGCDQIYEDRVSGALSTRPGLEQALSAMWRRPTQLRETLINSYRSLGQVTPALRSAAASRSRTPSVDDTDSRPLRRISPLCSWERFCTFDREPERRKVDSCARVSVEGVAYEVDPDLAGETVVLWWGLFDNELYVEKDSQRYGPYLPVDGPIPLHRYRKFKKSKTQKRADRIEILAKQLVLPQTAWSGNQELQWRLKGRLIPENSSP